jgi:hypothetical protein
VGLFELIKFFVKRRDTLATVDLTQSDVIKSAAQIYHELNDLLSKTDAGRVLILKTENGGGIPRRDGTLYSTVIYEVYSPPHLSIANDWNRQRLDKVYVDMLVDVDQSSGVTNITEFMPDSVLKNVYLSTGIGMSRVQKILATQKSYYYLSIAWDKAKTLSASDINAIRATSSNLERLLQKTK